MKLMRRLLLVLLVFAVAVVLASCKKKPKEKVVAKIEGADTPIIIEFGNPLPNLKEGVTASEKDGAVDLTSKITVTHNVDVSKWGVYDVTYKVKSSSGHVTRVDRKAIVGEFANYDNISFKFYPADLRHTFFAAAEKWLLETMTGGIPIQANSGFQMFSDRMQLVLEEYDPIMGFATLYADMNKTDEQVTMDDGNPGQPGKKTYRQAWGSTPKTMMHWLYDDSVSSDLLTLVLDALYDYQFTTGTDYDLLPSMAAELPEPVNPVQLEYNPDLVVSKVWRVKLRDDLKWTFHPNTPNKDNLKQTIDANDFIWTYKEALDQGWFRAISGGGDFFSSTQEIVNAKAYYDARKTPDPNDDIPWDQVGLKAIDDYTLEFHFVNLMSEWNVKYWLASFTMGPIHKELYESLWEGEGENRVNKYGTAPQYTAFNGAFYVDYFETDKMIRLVKNENFHGKDKIKFDGINIAIISDPQMRFQEFLAGKLDVTAVPSTRYPEYKDDPRIKKVPGATTFRLSLNGNGTVEKQKEDAAGPREADGSFVPEPILARPSFKKALYFAIDRYKLAYDIIKTVDPQMYHFTSAYIVDASTFTSFRETPQGVAVGQGFSPDTYGYNEQVAKALWEKALDEVMEDGYYKKGDTIHLTLSIQANSEAMTLLGNYLEEQFEKLFVSEKYNIKVDVEVIPLAFPDNYYAAVLIGAVDMGIGGISGSTLDAASFLEVYCSDNRGGFTMDWGIDTTQPEILVEYQDYKDGQLVTKREFWSFDAIVSALNGTVTVRDGMEVK